MKHFVTSPCGIVHVYKCEDGWRVYLYDWHHSTHRDEVQAVIMLQRLVRVKKHNA